MNVSSRRTSVCNENLFSSKRITRTTMSSSVKVTAVLILVTAIICTIVSASPDPQNSEKEEDITVKPRILGLGLNFLLGGQSSGFTTSVNPVIRTRVESGCRRLMAGITAPIPGLVQNSRNNDLSSTASSSSSLTTDGTSERRTSEDISVKVRSLWSTTRDPYFGVMSLCTQVIANQGSAGVSVPANSS